MFKSNTVRIFLSLILSLGIQQSVHSANDGLRKFSIAGIEPDTESSITMKKNADGSLGMLSEDQGFGLNLIGRKVLRPHEEYLKGSRANEQDVLNRIGKLMVERNFANKERGAHPVSVGILKGSYQGYSEDAVRSEIEKKYGQELKNVTFPEGGLLGTDRLGQKADFFARASFARGGSNSMNLMAMAGKFIFEDGKPMDSIGTNDQRFIVKDLAQFLIFADKGPLGLLIRHPIVTFNLIRSVLKLRNINSYADETYFSQMAYKFGDEGHIQKFRYAPIDCVTKEPRTKSPAGKKTDNYYRDELASKFHNKENICFNYQVQIIANDKVQTSDVEDTYKIWDEKEYPWVTIGEISIKGEEQEVASDSDGIPKQSEDLKTTGENCSFSINRRPLDEAGLGSLRAFRELYQVMHEMRTEVKGLDIDTNNEPNSIDELVKIYNPKGNEAVSLQ
ncbi:catalase [Bacteriovoracaceae bacterium]|nr:catalase [Bacteriovoracaceae bacterium]